MFGKLLRSTVFIKIVKWTAPKVSREIKERRNRRG